ncbi:unnamed protein product, partial [Laminaria digitata]
SKTKCKQIGFSRQKSSFSAEAGGGSAYAWAHPRQETKKNTAGAISKAVRGKTIEATNKLENHRLPLPPTLHVPESVGDLKRQIRRSASVHGAHPGSYLYVSQRAPFGEYCYVVRAFLGPFVS